MKLIDTHCHLTFKQLSGDIAGVLQRSRAAGITGWITVGTDAEHNRKCVELAERFDDVYATVGIHPHDAKDVTDETLEELRELAQREKVVAIGETGLDFHYNFSPPEIQREVFIKHLAIAREYNLPVIVHSREAFDETIEILDEHGKDIKRLVFHCFGGSAEQAKIVIDRGYYISFTGVVTFKNASGVREAVSAIPLERLMVETDCPYMSPEPMRKQKVNEPALMIHTAKYLAKLKEMDLTDFCEKVSSTSRDFFGI
ncbi:MAG: TatD family deoxyribonuclease [Planctomycetes bacterium]|nr:TatD family deoxyribonuclease [Planctomycetota bacterium]